ncbi:MAG: ABC transporter permease, partial [Comamonas sp.]
MMPPSLAPSVALDSSASGRALTTGDWTAASFADRADWRRLQRELQAVGQARSWDLQRMGRLDYVGAQILWRHWGGKRPADFQASEAQRDILAHVEQYSECEKPAAPKW